MLLYLNCSYHMCETVLGKKRKLQSHFSLLITISCYYCVKYEIGALAHTGLRMIM